MLVTLLVPQKLLQRTLRGIGTVGLGFKGALFSVKYGVVGFECDEGGIEDPIGEGVAGMEGDGSAAHRRYYYTAIQDIEPVYSLLFEYAC